jgi:isocitrate/isopropylmalate dehydrogenase
MTEHRVAVLPGDGIGPEVCGVARRCVDVAG